MAAMVLEFGSMTVAANDVRQSRCIGCDATTFWMECSEEDGVAKRTCTACKLQACAQQVPAEVE